MTPSRKAFEIWMLNVKKCIVGSKDPYPAGIEREAWKAWEAGRQFGAEDEKRKANNALRRNRKRTEGSKVQSA